MSFWQEISLKHNDVSNLGVLKSFSFKIRLKKNCWIFVQNIWFSYNVLLWADSLLSFHLRTGRKNTAGFNTHYPLSVVRSDERLASYPGFIFQYKVALLDYRPISGLGCLVGCLVSRLIGFGILLSLLRFLHMS